MIVNGKSNLDLNGLNTPDCIRTFSGVYMNVFEPTESMILIDDIAHALSNIPRFGGHLKKFYSVAQHALMCSYEADNIQDAYDSLHHDDSEAWLLDIPTPIKRKLSGYKELEDNLMSLCANKYGFNYPLSDIIKDIDRKILEFEWNHLVMDLPFKMFFDFKILTPEEAEKQFIDRHCELLGEIEIYKKHKL